MTLGTVAALLAGPLPASAASYVGDTSYGTATPKRGAALGGYTNSLGVAAATNDAGQRIVLSQTPGATPGAITLSRYEQGTGAFDTLSFGTVTVPTNADPLLGDVTVGTSVSELIVVPGTDEIWVVGKKGTNVVVWHLNDDGQGPAGGSTATGDLIPTALGTAYTSRFYVADAAVNSTGTLNVAVQATEGTGTYFARVGQVLGSGDIDPSYGTGGWATIPHQAGSNVLSLGGIAVSGGALFGTAQISGTTTADDSVSVVYKLSNSGAPATGFGDLVGTPATAAGWSSVVEGYSEAKSPKWQGESLADLTDDGTGNLVVSGKAGNSYFLAKVAPLTGAFVDTFGAEGVSQTIASSGVAGDPELAVGGALGATRYWLGNDMADGTAELFRWTTSGFADTPFGTGGTQKFSGVDFGVNPGSVTAEPITFDGGNPVIGAGSVKAVADGSRYDAASFKIMVAPTPLAPVIATSPADDTVELNADASFQASYTAGSTASTLRWESAPSGSTEWTPVINGGTNRITAQGPTGSMLEVLNVTASQHGTQYRIVVTNSVGTATSASANLLINNYPTITSNPGSDSVASGSGTSFTTGFTPATGGNPPVVVKWQWSRAGGEWADIVADSNLVISAPTTTTSKLTIGSAPKSWNGTRFRTVVSNTIGGMTSDPATLTVTGGVDVTLQPADQTAEEGNDATFTVDATGVPPVSYQWQRSDSGLDNSFEDISGATNKTYVWADVDDDDNGSYVQVKITDGNGVFDYSRKAELTVAGVNNGDGNYHKGDYDGDGKADVALWRPGNGTWYWHHGPSIQYGQAGDKPMVGNYVGDARNDPTIYRPSTGTWWTKGGAATQYGYSTDMPLSGADFDGDGTSDIALWRPSTGTWWIWGKPGVQFGGQGDIPLVADFDGDGKTDIALYRPSNGNWYVKGKPAVQWGGGADIPVTGDWDGDGKADITLFRPGNGTWYIKGEPAVLYGRAGDIPLAADFDGNGEDEFAMFRPSNGTWYITSGDPLQYGKAGDIPLPR